MNTETMDHQPVKLPARILGKTGFAVSEVGFGAWAIGGSWGEEVDETTALDALHAAVDAGVNFIDTADVYGGGRSEQLIGKLLKARSERIFVATKMGRGSGWTDSYEAVEAAAAKAAQRLGVETLDLVQLHCIPFATLQAGRVFEHLEKIKEKGLIRFYGASVETVEEGLFCAQQTECAALQVIFNIFRQKLIDELFPVTAAHNVGIIARVPLASGVLTGKFSADHNFAPGDHRAFNANGEAFNVGETFAGVPFERGVEFAANIREILGDEAPLSRQALRWILDFPAVSTVIPGAKTPQQARDNVAASSLPALDTDAHARLHQLYENEIAPTIRGAY